MKADIIVKPWHSFVHEDILHIVVTDDEGNVLFELKSADYPKTYLPKADKNQCWKCRHSSVNNTKEQWYCHHLPRPVGIGFCSAVDGIGTCGYFSDFVR